MMEKRIISEIAQFQLAISSVYLQHFDIRSPSVAAGEDFAVSSESGDLLCLISRILITDTELHPLFRCKVVSE